MKIKYCPYCSSESLAKLFDFNYKYQCIDCLKRFNVEGYNEDKERYKPKEDEKWWEI